MTEKYFTGRQIIEVLEAWAPKELAYNWDNVGLQLGTLDKPVKKVMITLDVLESVADEAAEAGVDLIIAHHPILFKSLKQLDTTTAKGRTIAKLMKHEISVYAAHTNLDITEGGVSDVLAALLDIEKTTVLVPSKQDQLIKLAVYVPEAYTDKVRKAIGNLGAGHIGNYSHCSFRVKGEGTFKPLDGTDPFIGSQGELSRVDEERLETILPESKLAGVIEAIKRAHPYEEPAYDLYPVKNQGKIVGAGRIGDLPENMTLRDLGERVKERYQIPALRVVGDLEEKVKRVAILGGSGEDFIKEAYHKGADVYITGDLSFHEAQDAWQMGLKLIDPGHHVEKFMKEAVQNYLQQKLGDSHTLQVITSSVHTEPFHFM
ncbi:Nif3-like dinuclear metal center hexameric protein [Virgibacillus senegalensis]|uniref:Nif3-like dinuclear metal center hexameric protein n=1 Tax=Virgibacillus senegalensis TaxID=1499679 RepID=UPI00069E6A43|nr:Nif3-like dinuclear metal center hexameric protein [Virgibacillus senegalensis]